MSTVVVGALGSGKSHLIRAVVRRLSDDGLDPLVLRAGGPLSRIPFGSLDASADPRAQQLRTGARGGVGSFVVVVDDVQELDAQSAAAVARAVYAGSVTALFGLTVGRDGRPVADAETAGLAIDLWLRGLADRVDLPELTDGDAEELLIAFGGQELDSVSRASVLWLANGSRMLLREFTQEAVTALAQGRDPMTAIRDARPNSRVAHSIDAHIAQFSREEQLALAILGRLPRIAATDAARVVPSDVLESLIEAGLVHRDGTTDHLLTANVALARGCDRVIASDEVKAQLRDAVANMLSEDAGWWSVPLARRIAEGWVQGDHRLAEPESVSEAVRVRLVRDAARSANDTGDHDLAAAIARFGDLARADLPLRVEALLADAGRGEHADPGPLVTDMLERGADCETMLRWMQLSGPLIADHFSIVAAQSLAAVADAACADSPLSGEMELMRVQKHAVALDWKGALAKATDLAARVGTSSSIRMRAAVLAAMAETSLGDADEAHRWYVRARRLAGEHDGTQHTTTWERLWAFSSEIITHGLAGTDARPSMAVLEDAYRTAAREGDPSTWTFAVLVAAGAAASIGDTDRALRELRGALQRSRPPRFAATAAYIEMLVTRALALQGRAEDARVVLDLADTSVIQNIPLLDHARLTAEACVLVAEGRESEALGRAREAVALAHAAPMLLASDLFVLLVLGEEQDAISSRIREIAEATSVPVARLLDARARQLVSEGAQSGSAYDTLQMSRVWGMSTSTGTAVPTGTAAPTAASAPPRAVHELTRREREIAMLVSEGLSNREIATRLFLSVRTVESHIYQARAKVDAATRGELGAMVASASSTPRLT